MGKFIVIEGLDGAGKTTVIEKLKIDLSSDLFTFVKDPGCTAIGEKIRTLLLDKTNSNMHPVTELMLFAASRAQMVSEIVLPELKTKNVISDRFTLSTFVYQDYIKDYGDISSVINFGIKSCTPDLVILLDIEPSLSASRINGRQLDRMESKGEEYYKDMRQKYLNYSKDIKNLRVVDASCSVEDVYSEVFNVVGEFVNA